MYRMIAKAEAIHEERYLKLLQRVKDETVFSRDEELNGSVAIADMFIKAKTHRKHVPLACMHKLTLSLNVISIIDFFSSFCLDTKTKQKDSYCSLRVVAVLCSNNMRHHQNINIKLNIFAD